MIYVVFCIFASSKQNSKQKDEKNFNTDDYFSFC